VKEAAAGEAIEANKLANCQSNVIESLFGLIARTWSSRTDDLFDLDADSIESQSEGERWSRSEEEQRKC
jgi:hypothetical protein